MKDRRRVVLRSTVGLIPWLAVLAAGAMLLAGEPWLPPAGLVAADAILPEKDPGLADLVRAKLRISRYSVRHLEVPGGLPESFRVTVGHEGLPKVLQLRRHSVRGPGFRLLLQEEGGRMVEAPPPPERTYRGFVEGEPSSLVAASLLPEGLWARVSPAGKPGWGLSPLKSLDPRAAAGTHLMYSQLDEEPFACGHEKAGALTGIPPEDAPPAGLTEEGEGRGAGAGSAGSGDDGRSAGAGEGAGSAGGGAADPCTVKVADVAFDTDYDYFAGECEGNPDTCTAIIEAGVNATNLIYVRDVKILHRLSTIVVRTDPATDFYSQFPDASNFGAMLVAFKDEWNANMGHINRDVAYYLTGKSHPEYGGLAYVGAVCSSWHYGMGIGGWGYEGIFRHEVGHNWNCGHTCGAERRYIMCGNSIDAISYFNIQVIRSYLESRTCLDEIPHESDPVPPYVRPDPVVTTQGEGPIPIEVVASDTDYNCDSLHLASHDPRSAFGAEIQVIDPAAPGGPEALLYLPRSGFTGMDFLRYSVSDGSGFEASGVALVNVLPRALICHLQLEETAGDEAGDSSGFGHEGGLDGNLDFATHSVAGRHGRALKFDGVDGDSVAVDHDAALDLRRGITVAAWFRVDAFAGDGESIVSKGDSAWRLKRDGTNPTLKFTCTGLSVSGSTDGSCRGVIPVNDGIWHHVAGAYDGSRIYLYVDGQLDRSFPASGLIHSNTNSVRVGDNAWNGAIDEVRIYNWGLGAEEILSLYEDGRVENTDPSPGKTGVIPGAALTWQGAPSATGYDVYLGTDGAAVAAATTSTGEYKGRVTRTSYAAGTEPGKTYYWRVDVVGSGGPRKGSVGMFTTSLAFTDFNEPSLNAASYTPGAGDLEMGFKTVSTPTDGDSPFAGVIETGSTPTSPIFSHRSVNAATTFGAVDLSERQGVGVSLMLQARDTGYEPGDGLEVYAAGEQGRVDLLWLEGGAPLAQRAGRGYATYAGWIPPEWEEASLVVKSTSNSSTGEERFDMDRISFFCYGLYPVAAFSRFDEPAAGATSYTPGPAASELGFRTTWAATGGSSPLVGVVEVEPVLGVKVLSHRSLAATTTFDAVDLHGRKDGRATVVLRVWDTGYESEDFIKVEVTSGAERVVLLNLTGTSGLADIPKGEYVSFWARIPPTWTSAALVVSSSSNSGAGSERFDVRSVELVDMALGDPCAGGEPPEKTFLRGDANSDGKVDISDGVRILNFLFLGGVALGCMDAADTDDSGFLNITDGVSVFGFLFQGSKPPPPPGNATCGADPSADPLDCGSHPPCE